MFLFNTLSYLFCKFQKNNPESALVVFSKNMFLPAGEGRLFTYVAIIRTHLDTVKYSEHMPNKS